MSSLKRDEEVARRLREDARKTLEGVRKALAEELEELADVEAYTGEHAVFVPDEGPPPEDAQP
jgi:hypothetical protein